MLVSEDRNGRKKRKNYHRVMILAGSVLSVAAAALMVIGIISLRAQSANSLELYTNAGTTLSSRATVMDGASISVRGYDTATTKVYYVLRDTAYTDLSGLDLSSMGTEYMEGSSITLTRSSTTDGTRYLYIQQKGVDGSLPIESYKISFYKSLAHATSTPSTSASNMASIKVGDEIIFSSLGTMYYTDDDSDPGFVRDSNGTIVINGERFRTNNPSMKLLDAGNTLTVPESWLSEGSKTIRVIAYKNGFDFSPITTFRFKMAMDQAQAPSPNPPTTAENPVTVESGTTVTLNTNTQGGTILYTMDGTIPVYTVTNTGTEYVVTPGNSSTLIYSGVFSISGRPGEQIYITAKTIKVSTSTGIAVMKDSDPAQYIYKIRELEVAMTPEATPTAGTELPLNSKIFLNTVTGGGTILYTTDGSTPDYEVRPIDGDTGYEIHLKGSTKVYGTDTSFISVAEPDAAAGKTFVVLAKTIKYDLSTGEKLMEDSSVGQFGFQVSEAEKVADPVAIPKTPESEPAIVKEGSKILLSCATAGASIYYTLDGTAPIVSEDGITAGTTKLYSATYGIEVPAGAGYFTVTAVARMHGMQDSATVQFNYRYPGVVAPPYVTPAEGTVSINTEVKLASLDEDAQIYYTLDNSEPTVSKGRLYSEPILLTKDTVIKAICVSDGISSATKTFSFKVAPELLPPSPSIQSGAVLTSGTTINLTAQKGVQIYYTLDGSSPKSELAMAGSMVTITGKPGDTIKLSTYAKGSNYSDSQIATYVYTISNYENGVKVNPEAGSKVKEGDVITLETDVTNGTIYFATGGDSPDSKGMMGTQVIVGKSEGESKFTLKATVVSYGSTFNSNIASFVYEYVDKPVAPKASVPDGAVLLKKQDIILTAEEGDIYYTMDGTEPDSKSDIYTDPISVTKGTTIRAICISKEGARSEVASFSYTFAQQAQAPVFSIKGGEVETGTTLTITSATPGAVIYYTTDGQVPDLNNQKNLFTYSGAIQLNKPVNIKAIAVLDRMTESEVTSAIFTVREPEIIVESEEAEEEEKQKNSNRLMSRRAYMNQAGGPTYSDFVLKSAATGVVISAEEGAIPVEARIEVSETAIDSILNSAVEVSAGREYGAVSGYEISLVEGTNAVKPTGDVEIGLPVSPEYQNNVISIAYVNEDGNVEIYETRRDNDMAYAHVTHFGRYCIVAPVNLEEEKANNTTVWLLCAVVGLMGTGYLLLRLGRKRNRQEK